MIVSNSPRARQLSALIIAVAAVLAVTANSVTSKEVGPSIAPGYEPSKQLDTAEITPEGRKSVERGTHWLLSAMRPDGMVGADVGQPPDISCTAMVGLALIAQGNTTRDGQHAAELSRIVDAVLNMAEWIPEHHKDPKKVTLVQRKIGLNADRFLAALFLSQILGEAGDYDESVRRTLDKLVRDISKEQGQDGTWGNDSWAPVLGTVLGWESLRAASSCGLRVDASATAAGEALRDGLKKSKYRNEGWMHDFYKNASSIRVLYSMGFKEDPTFKECVKSTLKFAKQDDRPFTMAGGEEFLAFYLVTECFLSSPNEQWESWYPTVSNRIISVQNSNGSWSGHHCIIDRTFCTAAAMLTILTPRSCMPISNL